MNKIFAASALAVVMSVTAAMDANAWTRTITKTGPYGHSTATSTYGYCYAGPGYSGCTRSVTRTGPTGNSVTHQGGTTCSGGSCYSTSVTKGPAGNVVTRQGSISR